MRFLSTTNQTAQVNTTRKSIAIQAKLSIEHRMRKKTLLRPFGSQLTLSYRFTKKTTFMEIQRQLLQTKTASVSASANFHSRLDALKSKKDIGIRIVMKSSLNILMMKNDLG